MSFFGRISGEYLFAFGSGKKGGLGEPPNALIMPAAVLAGGRFGRAFFAERRPPEWAGPVENARAEKC